jgi:hypothetical protein
MVSVGEQYRCTGDLGSGQKGDFDEDRIVDLSGSPEVNYQVPPS